MLMKSPLEAWIARKTGCEQLTREKLEQYQLAQLQKTVRLAKAKSLFYRHRLAGFDAEKITDFASFARLPFTYPKDLREDSLRFVCTSQADIARIVTLQTSGTTGRPKRVYFTKADQELTLDFFHHGMLSLTGPGDRVLILLPWQTPGSVGDLLQIALRRMQAVPLPYGPVSDPQAAVSYALQSGATAIVGIPVQVLAMARQPAGHLLRKKIKNVLLCTDYVPQAICRALEDAWGCSVFHHYGMTEMGLGGGVQCRALQGYHLREADLFFEIVDPASGEVLPEGETGEVVFTTLTREGMPLIRYRTGDVSSFLPDKCPCGTILRSLALIKNRVDGLIPFGSGIITLPDLDEKLFAFDFILDYKAYVKKNKEQSELQLVLKTADGSRADLAAVIKSVLTLPALLEGDQRRFMLKVSEQPDFAAYTDGTAKRTITVIQ
ncbi:MAG: phenylacetate--CoA ligase family protein [Firmicutes bacterium]|nr:phenylacetate--CoA ligase family protein [Bacillota bacterium]